MTYVRRLAEFAVACRDGELPAAVREDVPGRVLDVLGNCLAAYADPDGDAAPAVLRAVRRWGGSGESTVIGSGDRLPAPSAALVNGTLAHALDYDDTHLPSVLHPSASVVPAALAAAQSVSARHAEQAAARDAGAFGAEPGVGVSGGEVVAAVAAGIEVCGRLGMASYLPQERNSLFFEQGQHATSICGTLGAAVAAGLLFGLTADGIAHAVGVAASMGAGLLEANRTGGTVKRVHCGWAAHAGVSAAVLAAEGLTGPPTVLEGRFGFFQAWLGGRYDAEALLGGLGERWELLRTTYKPYPANHFTHPVIDCALALRRGGLDPSRIAEIEVGVPGPVLRTVAEPWEEKVRPRSPYHAKFSAPYTVAAALLGGGGLGLALEDFATLDPARLELAERVRCVADERASEIFPRAFAAVVRVRLRDGSALEHRVDSSRGGPEHPLSGAELEAKFRANAGRALPQERVGELVEAIGKLVTGGTVDDVLARTVREP
ncbi:2-methylcitrate dehydratase PrpD [Nonomuraea thailandensis]|uniref:2-methylcitrate dehydratase PrpD n=1 Tax=Nonomuraea thailandensis TaxID=1188745 RepID=A0A9X2GGR4_9ACTN|nr:MmgE/PrpD family protein [Nonomuraea thailandensis]MCP2357495.1 2-methylcitrate dehydratase PrpD [Nonomuraea thailandensis]